MGSFFNLDEVTLLILGIDIIVSIFLLMVSVRMMRRRPTLGRYLVLSFVIFLGESVFIILEVYKIFSLSLYIPISISIDTLLVMFIFYAGIMRGKSN